jgi:hypothetical protein
LRKGISGKKLGNLKTKSSPNLELIGVNFGRYFSEKMRPTPKNIAQVAKFRPIWSH